MNDEQPNQPLADDTQTAGGTDTGAGDSDTDTTPAFDMDTTGTGASDASDASDATDVTGATGVDAADASLAADEAVAQVEGDTGEGTEGTGDDSTAGDLSADLSAGLSGGEPEAPEVITDFGQPGEESGASSSGGGEESAPTSTPTPAAAGESDDLVVHSTRSNLEDVAPNASMEDLLRASEQQYRTLKHGDVVEGSVMKVGRDEILVDIGAKTEGIIPQHELQSLTPEEREAMAVGDKVLVSVVQPENNEGHSVLSLDRARQERSWRDLQKKFEAGEIIQAKVSGHNKGGLLVNLEGVRGFVPSSQISSMPPGEANKQAEMARLQGQTLPLKIIEINRNRNRLILSERQAVQEQRESMRTRLLRELEPGQIRPGTVSSICDFGAFVDIGGADGLIHLSEISWKRVSHPSDVLKVGDRVNVYVLSVDPNERKIALSLKRTQPEPWSTITENYTLGQIVRGTITQLTTFGAFARLEDGIEGLIHVSELAEGRVAHPKNVVHEGQVLDLKVIRIDPAKRRIGLSLKRVNEDAEGSSGTFAPSGTPESMGNEYTEARPMGQDELTEAHSEEGREARGEGEGQGQYPSRRQQFEQRRQQQERPQRQERQPQERQERQQPQRRDEDFGNEPMGALAQALAARFGPNVADAATSGTSGGGGSQRGQRAAETQPEAEAETPAGTDAQAEVEAEAPVPAAEETSPYATDETVPGAGETTEPAADQPTSEVVDSGVDTTAEEAGTSDYVEEPDQTDVEGISDVIDVAETGEAADAAEAADAGDTVADTTGDTADTEGSVEAGDAPDDAAVDTLGQSGGEGAPSTGEGEDEPTA